MYVTWALSGVNYLTLYNRNGCLMALFMVTVINPTKTVQPRVHFWDTLIYNELNTARKPSGVVSRFLLDGYICILNKSVGRQEQQFGILSGAWSAT